MLTEDNFDAEWTKPKQPLIFKTILLYAMAMYWCMYKKKGGGGVECWFKTSTAPARPVKLIITKFKLSPLDFF